MGKEFKKSVLKNGMTLLSEVQPSAKAISIGIWVKTGTRDEKPSEAGISHFLEHMVFKGTKKRSAYQISASLEKLGGDLNAYTTREYTCYHALVLKDHWKKALDVLADLMCDMKISKKDFDLERGVVLQEIAMSDDNHEEIIYDYLFEDSYGKHPLGRPILGTVGSLAKMKLSDVKNHYQKHYQGQQMIISVSGAIEHEQIAEQCQNLFKSKKKFKGQIRRQVPSWKKSLRLVDKEIEQTHLLLGMPTCSFTDRHRFEAVFVNTALGGGMTSLLYQAIREKRGLAYTVFSSLNSHMDSGVLNVYAGVEPNKALATRDLILKIMKQLKEKGLTKKQIEDFKTQITGGLLLGADDVENRMTSLAVNEMVFGQYRPLDKVLSEINQVSEKSVKQFLDQHFDLDQISWVALGPKVSKLKWN